MDEIDREYDKIMKSLPDTKNYCDGCGRKKESYLVLTTLDFYYCCDKCINKKRVRNLPDLEC